MPYGSIKVDNIVFTNGGSDQTITVSGLAASTSGNLTVTGTISGNTVRAQTVSGATVTGGVGQFTTLTGGTAGFTTLTGTTVTGTTANFASGNFTNISGGIYTITSGVFASGTASNPSLSFVGDSNTGIYASAVDQVSITTGGTERLRVDASGQIEAVSLGSASAPTYSFTTDPNTGIYSPGADQLAISTGGSVRLLVDASGNITTSDGRLRLGAVGGEGGQLELADPANTGSVYNLDADSATNARLFTVNNNTSLQIGQLSGIGGVIKFHTSASERVRIDDNGRLLVGTSSVRSTFSGSLGASLVQQEGAGLAAWKSITQTEAGGGAAVLVLAKTRSSGNTIVQNNDSIGMVLFEGNDGTDFAPAARIAAEVDGTPGVDDMPGRLVFATTADGASSPTERLRITSAGLVGIGTSAPVQKLTVIGASNDTIDETTGVLKLQDDGGNGLLFGTRTSSPYQSYIQSAFVQDTSVAQYSLLLNPIGGLVGIGTTSPGAALDVSGNIRLSGVNPNIEFNNGGAMVYGPASNTLAFATGGGPGAPIERARIDSSGRLLVGTSSATQWNHFSPDLPLQVARANSLNTAIQLTAFRANDQYGPNVIVGKSRSNTLGTNTAILDGDFLGELTFVGANGTSWSQGAGISARADGQTWADGDCPTRLVFSTTADGASSPTERMRIGANANVKITQPNTNADGLTIDNTNGSFTSSAITITTARAAGTSCLLFYGLANAAQVIIIYNNGNIVNANNSYGAISDIKLKENIVDANSQWDDLKALQVRNYNFKEGQTHTQIGLVAQEVELVSPGLVTESPDRDAEGNDLSTVTKSVNYSVLYMKAVKALQEAMERIETLEQRLNDAGIN